MVTIFTGILNEEVTVNYNNHTFIYNSYEWQELLLKLSKLIHSDPNNNNLPKILDCYYSIKDNRPVTPLMKAKQQYR